nr:immunoglobulin heavy chain junction region [Macaca mulatta]
CATTVGRSLFDYW